jgi:hypothetical protein
MAAWIGFASPPLMRAAQAATAPQNPGAKGNRILAPTPQDCGQG